MGRGGPEDYSMKTVFSLYVTVPVGVVSRLVALALVAFLLSATFVSRSFRLAARTIVQHNG